MLFLLALNPAYNQFLHNLTVHHMIANNLSGIRRFHLTVGDPIFTGTNDVYQNFFLTHADATCLFNMDILQFSSWQSHPSNAAITSRAPAAIPHVPIPTNDFRAAVIAHLYFSLQFFPQGL
jgi:hypothetical protein